LAEKENRFDDVWMRNANVSNVSANKETIICFRWLSNYVLKHLFFK